MAYFKIEQPNKPTKWIKSIDRANGTLEFSEDRNECFQQDSGFFADSEMAYLKFHFTETYPELEFMTIDTDYGYHRAAVRRQEMAVIEQDAPNDPMEADGLWNAAIEPQQGQGVQIQEIPHVAQAANTNEMWIDMDTTDTPW